MTTGNLTIQDNDTLVQYTAIGESSFNFPFPILETDELKVSRDQVLLTYGTDYSITGLGQDGGGYITLLLGASTPGQVFTLWQDMPIERLTGFSAGAAVILGTALNAEFAARLRVEQQLRREIRNSLRIPPDDPVSGQDMELPASTSRAGYYLAFDALGLPIAASGTGNDSALRTDLAKTTAGVDGSRLVGFRRTEAGAVASSVYTVLKRFVYIEDFGGAPGAGDNSTAFNAAIAALVAQGGGELRFGTPGEWRMNVVIAADNIWLAGCGGRAEFDVNCIRPYNLASAAITWGDGVNVYRYCGMRHIAMSGTDDPGGANYNKVAHSAPQCLLVRGGMIGLQLDHVWLYNGVRTLSLETTATAPITGLRFHAGGARNDIEDSANARTIYCNRLGIGLSNGYFTDNVFLDAKFNGPGGPAATLGYLAEIDGTIGGIILEFLNCYLDFRTDSVSPTTVCHGILMKGGNSIRGQALTLDAGSAGAVYIESDQAPYDMARLFAGFIFCNGGGLVKFAGPVYVVLPSEAQFWHYRPRLNQPNITGLMRFTTTADPFDAGNVLPYVDTDSATGPVTMNRSDFSVKTAGKGLRVAEGANARQGTAVLVAGSKVVANTSVTANSRILLTSNADGGTPGFLRVSARVAGVSFTITSSNGADTSTVAYQIFEPA
jgi:hypothetical protein